MPAIYITHTEHVPHTMHLTRKQFLNVQKGQNQNKFRPLFLTAYKSRTFCVLTINRIFTYYLIHYISPDVDYIAESIQI